MEEGGMLTGGDFVIDAHTVAAIGNGSSQAGGEVLDNMMPNVENPDESFRGLVLQRLVMACLITCHMKLRVTNRLIRL